MSSVLSVLPSGYLALLKYPVILECPRLGTQNFRKCRYQKCLVTFEDLHNAK